MKIKTIPLDGTTAVAYNPLNNSFKLLSREEKHDCDTSLSSLIIENFIDDEELGWLLTHQVNRLVLSITENCNFRCRYCGYNYRYYCEDRTLESMTPATAKKAIDLYLKSSAYTDRVQISFYGGEALLEIETIIDCVEYTKLHTCKPTVFSLSTNGLLLTDEIVDFLVENDIMTYISLDGPSFIHDTNRRTVTGKSTHAEVIHNIKRIKDRYPEFFYNNISILAVNCPPDNLNTATDYLNNLGVSVSMVDVVLNDYYESFLKQNSIDANYAHIHFCDNDWGKLNMEQLKVYKRYSRSSKHTQLHAFPAGYCIPGVQKMYVRCDGTIYPCERVDENNDIMAIGSVDNGFDLERVKALNEAYIGLVASKCSNCWAIHFCSYCFACMNEMEHDKDYCDKIRNKCEEDIRIFYTKIKNNPELMKRLDSLTDV